MQKKEGMIKYALHSISGKPVFIRHAVNGLKCDCVCFDCGKAMEAVQPNVDGKRAWFFRHHADSNSNCGGGQMTALHASAQYFILNASSISTPEGFLNYCNAKTEVGLPGLRPDVTVTSEYGTVHFEVEVENPLSLENQTKYRQGEHRCITIDLTKVDREIAPEELKKLVLEELSNKRSIFWEPEIEEDSLLTRSNVSDDSGQKLLLFLFLVLMFFGISRRRI